MGEFDFIGRLQQRLLELPSPSGVDLGIGDDGAILSPPPDTRLVVTSDTLNAGVHFDLTASAFDIGFKCLAVNLSDLAAMGAEPWVCTLNVTLPSMDADWMDEWVRGFIAAAQLGEIQLIGGDTTRGPIHSFTVTACGLIPVVQGMANGGLRRSNALVGDDVWVSGTLGDAALALRLGSAALPAQRVRLHRPTPRISLGLALRELNEMGGCCDLSDGLLQDLGHIARASAVHIEIDADRIPMSQAVQDAPGGLELAVSGGDDYELAFTAAVSQREAIRAIGESTATPLTRIGRVVGGAPGVVLIDPMGRDVTPARLGWDHFDT